MNPTTNMVPTVPQHQVLFDLACRACGVSVSELAAALGVEPRAARVVIQRGRASGLLHSARPTGYAARYFYRAGHAVAWLRARSAPVPDGLIAEKRREEQAEIEAQVKAGRDRCVLVAQPRRRDWAAERCPPDRPVPARPGQDDFRACPSLMHGQTIAAGGPRHALPMTQALATRGRFERGEA